MATCEWCRASFVPKSKKHVRFCSRACANARGLAKPIRGIQPRPCLFCKSVFKPHHRGQVGSFCSRRCAGLGKTKDIPVRQCRNCQREFRRPGTREFCSVVCSNQFAGRQRLAGRIGPPPWAQHHRAYSRDYKLVRKAIANGDLNLAEGWTMSDGTVQEWLGHKRAEIESERAHALQYAVRSGWPTHLGPRCVQVLNLLGRLGVPVGVTQIANVLSLDRSSVRKYLHRLMSEGWIIGLSPSHTQRFTLGPMALAVQQEHAQWDDSHHAKHNP